MLVQHVTMANQQVQHFNESLTINNEELDAKAIIRELSKAENLQLKKLALINVKADTICISEMLNLLSNLKCSLVTLSIRSKGMNSADTQTIADCIISNNTVLTKLELAGNIVWTTMIASTQSSLLQKLSLKRQCIIADTALAIAAAVTNQRLTELSFVQCSFQEGSIELIMAAIKVSAVSTLILEDISFGEDDAIAVLDCITQSKLTKLSLYDSRSNFLCAAEGVIENAVRASSLTTLDGRKSLFFRDTKTIIGIIKFSSVTKFKFDQNGFTSEDSMEIIDAIKDRPDFRIIPMFGMSFTNEILAKVCDLLKSSVGLTQLDLSNCYLAMGSTVAIINSTKESSITSINFGSNYINRKAIHDICSLLENCVVKKIKFIGLTSTTIDFMLPSIKASALIKFKMNDWSSAGEGAQNKIGKILEVHRAILNRGYKTKSARL